jgi:antitoxin HicB
MFDYPVILTPQPEGGFVATFPDIPEAVTQGEDRDETVLRAVDALETALSFYIDDRRPLPVPSKTKGLTVCLSVLKCTKLALYKEMQSQGVKKTELARRLGWNLPQVDRLLDLSHASRFDVLESVLRYFGKRLAVTVD